MNAPARFDIPQRLTHAEAMPLLASLLAAVAGGVRTINLEQLSEFDSSALSVLLAVRRASANGAEAQFINVPDKLSRLAALYGADGLVFGQPSAAAGASPAPELAAR